MVSNVPCVGATWTHEVWGWRLAGVWGNYLIPDAISRRRWNRVGICQDFGLGEYKTRQTRGGDLHGMSKAERSKSCGMTR